MVRPPDDLRVPGESASCSASGTTLAGDGPADVRRDPVGRTSSSSRGAPPSTRRRASCAPRTSTGSCGSCSTTSLAVLAAGGIRARARAPGRVLAHRSARLRRPGTPAIEAAFPPPRPARTTLGRRAAAARPADRGAADGGGSGVSAPRFGRRHRRRRRGPLLGLLPAPARGRRHRARVQPRRQRRLLGQRRLGLPGSGRAAARARPHLVRDALAARPQLGALLPALASSRS